jgi:asparagine synthetase B (glutamine-hydrolysing)
MEQRLTATGEFDTVWRPAPGWLAAQATLPESEPDQDAVRKRGFAFVEGRDRLERGGDPDWLDRVAHLADRSPHRLAELPGDFAFVRFRADGSVLGVRSCAGLAPLYLHRREGGGLALGTLLNYFPRFIPGRFHPDPLINASWVPNLRFIHGRTFVERVSILPRASHTELLPGHPPRTGVYWDPRPGDAEELRPSPEHPRELRRILIETLSRDLDPKGRNLLMLSGGVDSSSLAALAAGALGHGLSSWSLIPPAEPEHSRELSYVDSVVSRFGIEPAQRLNFTEEIHRFWIAGAQGFPFQIVNPALTDLPRVRAEQEVRVLMCGLFADEICAHRQRMPDWLAHTSLRSLLVGAPLPFGRHDYVSWARRKVGASLRRPPGAQYAGELPGWAHPEAGEEYWEWLARRRAAWARDRRPLRDFADRVAADGWVPMNWEGTTPLGVRRVLPFFNREVLELAFQCHPRELLGPGPKRLLRDALSDDVPAEYLLRPDKAVWTPHLVTARWTVDGAVPAAAAPIVRPDWLPHLPPGLPFNDGMELAYATGVAEYLARHA